MTNSNNNNLLFLTKEEYETNKNFYRVGLKNVSASLGFSEEAINNWDQFFESHLINSVVLLIENGIIVSFMYAAPHAEYDRDEACWVNHDLSYWHIRFIQTHKNHQKRGYAYQVLSAGLRDMVAKGAQNIECLPNNMSRPLFQKIITEFDLSSDEHLGSITLQNVGNILLTTSTNRKL